MLFKILKKILCLILICLIPFNLTACMGVKAHDLMKDITPGTVQEKQVTNGFVDNCAYFGLNLFKNSYKSDENSLVSPLSVMLALSMTANGADNQTLQQMERVLGGNISIDELNEYLYSYTKNLPSDKNSKFQIANSIWFRDTLEVEKDFLQKNADYYGAAAYKSPFDDNTVKDINKWVKDNTDGMIDQIIDEIDTDTIMFLINAIVFDAKWEEKYDRNDIKQGVFKAPGGIRTVDFMVSDESLYLDDGKATGFIKSYEGGYSFVALLPNEDLSIDQYIKGLTGSGFMKTIKNAKEEAVIAHLPKFSHDYTVEMNEALKSLGIVDAFYEIRADFSRLGKPDVGNIYISEVLHKTHITVDEQGTRAGAVTKVEMKKTAGLVDPKLVKLDRPFVYAIIDDKTSLPIFIGTVLDPQ